MKIIKVLNNPPCIFLLFDTIRKTNRPKKGTIKKTTSTINAISMFPEFTFTFISFSIHLSILPTPYELRPYEPSSWCTQYAPCFSRVNQERQRSKKKIRTSKSALYCARQFVERTAIAKCEKKMSFYPSSPPSSPSLFNKQFLSVTKFSIKIDSYSNHRDRSHEKERQRERM